MARFPTERLGDLELVEAMAQGDAEGLAAAWDRYSSLVRGVLRANLGFDPAEEDLLQEVFLVLFRSAREIRDGGALKSFLVQVTVRSVFVELRRRRVRRWVKLSADGDVPELPTAPRDTEAHQALNGLYRLLSRMPHRRRVAFVLRQVQGLELIEVAEALGVSESTVKRELARARAAIYQRARVTEPALWEYLCRFGEDEHA